MLTEKRYEIILNLLKEKKSITVAEVKDILNTSESTVRRDITALGKEGKLIKVFGGAVALDHTYTSQEPTVAQKVDVNRKEKQRIAKYAASFIKEADFVYLDAGTTTECMIPYITEKKATYVTNAVTHARMLANNGFKVFLIGGEFKASTEAIVGSQALETLRTYHFTKGFFGSNGVSRTVGFTTPDANEALVKKVAFHQCQECFVLSDFSKFGSVSSVTFAEFEKATVITDQRVKGFENCKNLLFAK